MNLARDALRRRRRRRYVGPWLPSPIETGDDAAVPSIEPVLPGGDTTAGRYDMLESVSYAFLIALEALTPQQRAVLLLRDVFDYGYADIAAIVGKSEDNVRQLATRARKHVEQRRPRFQTTREQRDELAARFFGAVQQGDLAGLEALLAADVEMTGDGGGKVPALAEPLRGRARVAHLLADSVLARLPGLSLRLSEVNGGPGAVFVDAQERLISVIALEIADGRITSIRSVVNPDKLKHLGPVGDFMALVRAAQ
jgi:RNA polymerase sigma-70 factor (ECF subfamily)